LAKGLIYVKGKYGQFVKPRIPEIIAWIRAGAPDKEVARKLGIAYSTLRDYIKQHPELADAVTDAKVPANEAVVNALYKKATGYFIPVKKPYKLKTVEYDEEGRRIEKERIEIVEIEEYIEPEVQAMIFWLNNRKPGEWIRNNDPELLRLKKEELELKRQAAEANDWGVI
jgi:transposase-like protein